MNPVKVSDPASVRDMLEACADILEWTQAITYEQLLADRMRKYATNMRFAVLGEAVKRLSAEFRGRNPHVPWQEIAGMRDRLIHGYDRVDYGAVWKTAA